MITQTKFKFMKLCDDGYFYTVHRDNRYNGNGDLIDEKKSIEWKCCVTGSKKPGRERPRCPGRVITYGLVYPIIEKKEHNHEPVPEEQECLLAYNDAKRLAEDTNDIPRQICNKVCLPIEAASAIYMTRTKQLSQMITRVRRKKRKQQKHFKNREEIELLDEMKYTFSSKLFLWDDSGKLDAQRIIIFATRENIELLSESNEWFIDGTFSVSPDIFKQLVTLNVIYSGMNLPLVYALLPNKAELAYKKFFDMLLNNNQVSIKKPVRFMVDFELAIINAIKKVFKCKGYKCLIDACYFHFCQSLWRNLVEKGLLVAFRKKENSAIRMSYRQLVPLNDVNHVFNLIVNSSPPIMKPFFDYFEEYYIGNYVEGSKSTRVVPRFPREIWNCHERVIKELPRTNNSLEAWHKSFALEVPTHPTIDRLIEKFKIEQKRMETNLAQLRAGDFYERKKEELHKDTLIKKEILNYNREFALKTLNSISMIMRNTKK